MYGITNPTAETFARVVELIRARRLKPLLDRTFPLAELRAAQAVFLERAHVGKLVVVP
jgi:NADPH:quinone reductase-like Zn-dependent oxidoreductase